MKVSELKAKLLMIPHGLTQEEFDNLNVLIEGEDDGENNVSFNHTSLYGTGLVEFEIDGQTHQAFGLIKE